MHKTHTTTHITILYITKYIEKQHQQTSNRETAAKTLIVVALKQTR